MDRATLTIAQTATILGLSEKATRQAVKRGDLPALVIGGRILILRAPLERILQTGGLSQPARRTKGPKKP